MKIKALAVSVLLGFSLNSAQTLASPVDCTRAVERSPIVKKVIYFEVGQFGLSQDSKKKMDELIEVVTGNPSLKVCAFGQADKQGDAESNKKLSLKRAESAKSYLIKKGLPKNKVETAFRGEAFGSFSLWGTGEKADEDRRVEVSAYSE